MLWGRNREEGDAVSGLQALGLNLYESRAYVALLAGGQRSAKEIGQVAMIPQSRTYDVLESLATKGFAMATPSTPKHYTPVPFDRVLPSQYNARKQEIQLQAAKAQEEAQARLDRLSSIFSRLMEDLKSSGRPASRVPEPVWVVEGRENIERTIVSLIQGAKSDVMRITRPPDLGENEPFDPFYLRMVNWKYVSEAANRGVRIRWLTLEREIPSYPGLKVIEPPERRFFEHDEDIAEKFFLADGESVLLNLYDPRLSGFGSVAMLMHSESACAVFREHFETMWDKARPLKEVLPEVRARVSETCTKMREAGYSRAEVTVYKGMAEIGGCTDGEFAVEMRKRRLREPESSKAFAKLEAAGLVYRNRALGLAMVETPAKVMASLKSLAS